VKAETDRLDCLGVVFVCAFELSRKNDRVVRIYLGIFESGTRVGVHHCDNIAIEELAAENFSLSSKKSDVSLVLAGTSILESGVP